MNILHINSESTWRGGEQQLAYLMEGQLDIPELQISVMGRANTPLENWCHKKNIPFISAQFKGSIDIPTAFKIAKYCKSQNVDIMHAHTSHAHSTALYSKLLANPAKLILHRRVAFPVKNNFLSQWKYRSKHLEHIICISQCVQNVLTDSTKSNIPSTVVYDAINPERCSSHPPHHANFTERFNLPQSKYTVINISAITSEKDYFTFVDTAKIVCDSNHDVIFLIAGDGKERATIQQYIETKNLSSRVFLLGFIKDIKDIKDLFDHADILLMTSKQEGLGTTILDAFANDVPVVATAAGGIPEIVQHKVTGLLAPIGDSNKLASHIQQMLSDSALRFNLTQQAKQLIDKNFLIPKMVKNTHAIYKGTFDKTN